MKIKKENAIIRATIQYHDNEYSTSTGLAIAEVLDKYGLMQGKIFHTDASLAVPLPGTRTDMINQFAGFYADRHLLSFSLEDPVPSTDYCRVIVAMNYQKQKQANTPNPAFRPWNTCMIDCTYGAVKYMDAERSFLSCIQELISLLDTIFVSIDDIENSVALQKQNDHIGMSSVAGFRPDCIRTIFWGNYWSESVCKKTGMARVESAPFPRREIVSNGVMFFLSNQITDNTSTAEKKHREKLMKHFNFR